VCEKANISINKNSIIGEKSPMNPSGIRLGTPAVTTRGMQEKDVQEVVKFLVRVKDIALGAQEHHGKKLNDFKQAIESNQEVIKLKHDVTSFMKQFPVPTNVSIE